MEPPICTVCGREFAAAQRSGEGALLHFQRTEGHEELGDHETGHPDNAAWFCPDHADSARQLSHLTLPEAMDRLSE